MEYGSERNASTPKDGEKATTAHAIISTCSSLRESETNWQLDNLSLLGALRHSLHSFLPSLLPLTSLAMSDWSSSSILDALRSLSPNRNLITSTAVPVCALAGAAPTAAPVTNAARPMPACCGEETDRRHERCEGAITGLTFDKGRKKQGRPTVRRGGAGGGAKRSYGLHACKRDKV